MLNLDYPDLLNLFPEHIAPPRTESASFLIWFLENFYRLDAVDAIDSVCDQNKDKGVDGIYVNENNNTIVIFQSKIAQKTGAQIGDVVLKEFKGTLSQFENKEKIERIVKSNTTAPDVAKLITDLGLAEKIETYDLQGVFLSNADLDGNGKLYAENHPEIVFIGRKFIEANFISQERTKPVSVDTSFDITGFSVSSYVVDSSTKAIIAPVKASELVTLEGIKDQSLFALNVRGPLGQTQVNKDIVKSIKEPKTHKLFPLFHNGITIICDSISDTPDRITIKDYFVVNGCQSLYSLYENQISISDNLRILTKFIKVDVESELSSNITRISNNQNGVKPRDFKSNNPIQVRLQNEVKSQYRGIYFFEVKRGEPHDSGDVISNELAGLQFMAFDLKEPWGTHRKYQVFDDKYTEIWGRPEVNADRLVMCHVIMETINSAKEKINNKLFAKYALTRYIILYLVRSVLENDNLGKKLLENPKPFVRAAKDREHFKSCISKMIDDVIVDVNGEVDEYGVDFDYRGRIREEPWVKDLKTKVVNNYLKLVQRNRIDSFEVEWNRKV